jgi:hypothetical protein
MVDTAQGLIIVTLKLKVVEADPIESSPFT